MINEANKRNIFHFLRKNCTNIAYNDPTNHDLTKPDVSLMSLMSLMTSPCLGFSYLSCQSFHRSSRGRSRSSGWCIMFSGEWVSRTMGNESIECDRSSLSLVMTGAALLSSTLMFFSMWLAPMGATMRSCTSSRLRRCELSWASLPKRSDSETRTGCSDIDDTKRLSASRSSPSSSPSSISSDSELDAFELDSESELAGWSCAVLECEWWLRSSTLLALAADCLCPWPAAFEDNAVIVGSFLAEAIDLSPGLVLFRIGIWADGALMADTWSRLGWELWLLLE